MKQILPNNRFCRVSAALVLALATLSCSSDEGGDTPSTGKATPYVTRVVEFRPAPGQFVNQLPEYREGDTPEDMNRKALEAIGNNRRGMVSLGGFGGYIVVGFDHTIENKPGLCDFRVLGNAFYASGQSEYGSSEPGVIQVAWDANSNGRPDEDEWYEIAGSSYPTAAESWLDKADEAGNDIRTVRGYSITYYRPAQEPGAPTDEYIRWEDNQQEEGYMAKNATHLQSYFPQWLDDEELTFEGTRLPQNGIDLSGAGTNYALYRFAFGYADNDTNESDASAIDIDWAVDASGAPVHLSGVDFIRIHTGVNQVNGWLGECSTEVMGVTDLHLTGEELPSEGIGRQEDPTSDSY